MSREPCWRQELSRCEGVQMGPGAPGQGLLSAEGFLPSSASRRITHAHKWASGDCGHIKDIAGIDGLSV